MMNCWKCGAVLPKDTWLFYGLCDSCYNKGYRSEDTEKEVDAFNLGRRVERDEIIKEIQREVETFAIRAKEEATDKQPDIISAIASMK